MSAQELIKTLLEDGPFSPYDVDDPLEKITPDQLADEYREFAEIDSPNSARDLDWVFKRKYPEGMIRTWSRKSFDAMCKHFGATLIVVKPWSRNKAVIAFNKLGGRLIFTRRYNGWAGMCGQDAAAWVPPGWLPD